MSRPEHTLSGSQHHVGTAYKGFGTIACKALLTCESADVNPDANTDVAAYADRNVEPERDEAWYRR